jgi:hypothetical protein
MEAKEGEGMVKDGGEGRKSEGHNEECRLYEGRKEVKKGSEGRK